MSGFEITSIETQKKRQDRFSVFLNHEFWRGVSLDTLHELQLVEGVALTAAEREALEEAILVLETLQRAYAYLSYKDRSEAEVERKLQGVLRHDDTLTPETITHVIVEVVRRLKHRGFLDDADLATQLAANAQARKYSRRHAQQYLYEKGLNKEIIAAALEEHYPEAAEEEVAAALAAERYKRYRGATPNTTKAAEKTKRFLLQRGFNWDLVRKVTADLATPEGNDAE